MADSTSKAVAKRSRDNALMPPPPKRIKRPAKVLDEDAYTDALSHIIARDFFPGLLESESQQEYMNALESRDSSWISEAGMKLSEVMTPGPDGRRLRQRRGTSMTPTASFHARDGETPRGKGGETPGSVVSTRSSISTQTARPTVDTDMSLSSFQATYTSEDNESFYKLLDKQNVTKSEQYAWMWAGNKIPAARQIAYREQQAAKAAITQAAADSSDGQLDALLPPHPDSRPAMPDSWPSRPDNNLMFGPSSIEDSHSTVQQTAEDRSRAGPKAVIYDNTRLPSATSTHRPLDTIPPSPTLSAVRDAIAGHPRYTASEIASMSGDGGGTTPRVNGYAFVDSEPETPRNGSPTTTTGIASSPADYDALLGAGDATPNPFSIKEASKREGLHHRMVDRVARSKRTGKREAERRTPVPRFASSPRVARGGLTPAALSLLGKVGGTPGSKSIWANGKTPLEKSGLRESWTPVGR